MSKFQDFKISGRFKNKTMEMMAETFLGDSLELNFDFHLNFLQ